MRGRFIACLLPLLLSGCLLPQPDTPPIKPGVAPGNALPTAPSLGRQTAPVSAPATGNATAPMTGNAQSGATNSSGPVSGSPGVLTPVTAPAELSGSVRGLDATAIAAVEGTATPTFQDLAQDGTFTLSLPAGSDALAFKLADGRTVKTTASVTLAPGQMLALTITLSDAPLTATIDEQTPLVVSASAAATPSPTQ